MKDINCSRWRERRLLGGALAAALTLSGCVNSATNRAGSATIARADGLALEQPATMQIIGRHLYSAAGEKVVLRGVNEMFAFSRNRRGEGVVGEIAKTGANALRIVTVDNFSASDLDAVVAATIAHGMIAVPECHSATGRWDRLSICVDYWTRPEIVAVIRKHEKWVLLNIANEAGAEVSRSQFVEGYRDAIRRIRAAGIRVPLVVDGTDWGKEYRMLLEEWDTLNRTDPERKIIVSAHSYWTGSEDERKAHYRAILNQAASENIPFILGEGPTPSGYDCTVSPYQWAMSELDRYEIGWLAWSWGMAPNGDCREQNRYDMTEGGMFGKWKNESGRVIAVDHPASIARTSRRPCSIANAGERCVRRED